MIDDAFRHRIRSGETSFGIFVEIPHPQVVEIIGGAGFDFVVVDGEHGPMDPQSLEQLIRAADLSGMATLYRVPENRPVLIGNALDRGATGVVVPQVSTPEAARAAVRAARFSPEGERGLNPAVRGGDYFRVPTAEFCTRSNEAVVLAVQVEGREGVENLEPIAAVEGYDVIFIGPFDLSQSFGVPGEVRHRKVVDAVQRAVELAREHKKAVATLAVSLDEARFWAEQGITVICYQADTGLLASACDAAYQQLETLRAQIGRKRRGLKKKVSPAEGLE